MEDNIMRRRMAQLVSDLRELGVIKEDIVKYERVDDVYRLTVITTDSDQVYRMILIYKEMIEEFSPEERICQKYNEHYAMVSLRKLD